MKRQKQQSIGELQGRGVVGLTKAQMAAALQISVRSLNGLMARGEVAYWRIGGRLIRFRVEDAVRRGGFSAEERFGLARKAFARTAAYDAAISNTFHAVPPGEPGIITLQFAGGRPLRYGENPHQQGFVFGTSGVAGAVPLQGKAMSYNNYLDLHAAVSLVREFPEPCAVIVKHNNPCGVATGKTITDAYLSAREIDPDSAYGSVVALNRGVDSDLSREICATYVEVVAAPSFSPESLATMAGKANMRVVALPAPSPGDEVRSIDGGILLQRTPAFREEWKVVSDRDPTPREMRAMQIAWKVCAATRSNSIVFADQDRVIGIGAGQMSRVDAARIAVMKALFPLKNTAVASDAFLPFADTLEVAAEAGATALVQPGGSIRDDEVIAAANRRQMAMVFTGIRHFRH